MSLFPPPTSNPTDPGSTAPTGVVSPGDVGATVPVPGQSAGDVAPVVPDSPASPSNPGSSAPENGASPGAVGPAAGDAPTGNPGAVAPVGGSGGESTPGTVGPIAPAAPPPPAPGDAVRYSAQTLATEEKTQARTNIGAASAEQGQKADSAIQPGNPALTDARPPTGHRASHAIGGTDSLFKTDPDIPAVGVVSFASAGIEMVFVVDGLGEGVFAGEYKYVTAAFEVCRYHAGDQNWVIEDDFTNVLFTSLPGPSYRSPHRATWSGDLGFGDPSIHAVTYGNFTIGDFVGQIYICRDEAWICTATDGTLNGTVWTPIVGYKQIGDTLGGVAPPSMSIAIEEFTEGVIGFDMNGQVGKVPWWKFKDLLLQWLSSYHASWIDGNKTFVGDIAFASTARPTSSGTGTPASNSLVTAQDVGLVLRRTAAAKGSTQNVFVNVFDMLVEAGGVYHFQIHLRARFTGIGSLSVRMRNSASMNNAYGVPNADFRPAGAAATALAWPSTIAGTNTNTVNTSAKAATIEGIVHMTNTGEIVLEIANGAASGTVVVDGAIARLTKLN